MLPSRCNDDVGGVGLWRTLVLRLSAIYSVLRDCDGHIAWETWEQGPWYIVSNVTCQCYLAFASRRMPGNLIPACRRHARSSGTWPRRGLTGSGVGWAPGPGPRGQDGGQWPSRRT